MSGFCTKCGKPLGADAKFCVSCGAPRPNATPPPPELTPESEPAPVVAGPEATPVREVTPEAPAIEETAPAAVVAPAPPPRDEATVAAPRLAGAVTRTVEPGNGNRRVLWIAGVVVLVIAAGIGGFALSSGGGGDKPVVLTTTTTTTSRRSTTTTTRFPTERTAQPAHALVPLSVVGSSTRASASDACTPPNPTIFDASNVRDGKPDSAWMPAESDPSPSVTLSFAGPVQISSLQLVDGYPKQDPCRPDLNRFYQFMRPTLVSVDLNDGSPPRQLAVTDTPTEQTLSVRGTTNRITLTVLESAPPDPSRIQTGTQIPFSIPAIGEITVKGSSVRE